MEYVLTYLGSASVKKRCVFINTYLFLLQSILKNYDMNFPTEGDTIKIPVNGSCNSNVTKTLNINWRAVSAN